MLQLGGHRRHIWVSIATGLLSALAGCHTSYYRQQADVDAGMLIQEKIIHPHWDLPRQTIDIDPRSRMFDPFNPDCEPMPEDDPYSHELMHCVDDKKGWSKWHANGDTDGAENPVWKDFLPLDENGVLLLDAKEAYQLSLIHSRDYQQQFETLYLSALDVSAERFRFDTQFFGGYAASYTASGQNQTPRSQLVLETFTEETGRFGLPTGVSAPTSGDILVRKAFATGAELAVGIANSLTWDFAGADNYSSFTILDFSLVQPLLRLAGRERVLEQLTLSERQLLANVRQMERYRRAFLVEIMTGRDAGTGATRRGGVFGGAGLEGFTGVGGGGFGRIGGDQQFSSSGQDLTVPRAGGFLGLLQAQQDIRIQQANIAGLRSNLVQLRESLRESLTKIPEDAEEIVRERLQIAQARQALLNSETQLLTAQVTYQQFLDQFKSGMGLPPSICIVLNDDTLSQFNLIDPSIIPLQNELTELREQVGRVNEVMMGRVRTVEMNEQQVNSLEWNNETERDLRQLRARLTQIRDVRERSMAEQLSRAEADIEKLSTSLESRIKELRRLHDKYIVNREKWDAYGGLDPCNVKLSADIDPSVFDTQRLEALPGELRQELARIRERLEASETPVAEIEALLEELLGREEKPSAVDLYRELESPVIFGIPNLLSELSADVLDLSLLQARARVDAVELTPIDIPWNFAVELARRYRHDWMNARATLVDTWRLIYFNADALQSTLDFTFSGDLRNVSDNPFDLSARAGQLRVGLEWDGPWTRLRERNTYRQALIEYQQARRSFYNFEDRVAASLRDTIRTVELNQLNFEERRIAVLSAIDQVVLNDEIQKFREERGLASGATAARDAVSALTDLQQAQNLFLGVWVTYEALRMILDLDLGTMQIDAEGNWIDPGPMGKSYGLKLPPWDCDGAELLFEPNLGLDPDAMIEMLPDEEVAPGTPNIEGAAPDFNEALPRQTAPGEAPPEEVAPGEVRLREIPQRRATSRVREVVPAGLIQPAGKNLLLSPE